MQRFSGRDTRSWLRRTGRARHQPQVVIGRRGIVELVLLLVTIAPVAILEEVSGGSLVISQRIRYAGRSRYRGEQMY